jgi:hypothetical protein
LFWRATSHARVLGSSRSTITGDKWDLADGPGASLGLYILMGISAKRVARSHTIDTFSVCLFVFRLGAKGKRR